MKMNRTHLLGLLAAASLLTGCATTQPTPPPLTYLASKRPDGPIKVQEKAASIETKRGGFYVLNKGFRPAPDIGAYVQEIEKSADASVLHDADVELSVPFALDILMFGFQFGNDTTLAGR
ncbi:MAG: hypothetical protein PHR35_13745 [Kiritimatiellae bacterium]|nr:hypothetical protein [Kiritimatiellia bacterium]